MKKELPKHWKVDRLVENVLKSYPSMKNYPVDTVKEYFTHFANLCFEIGQTEAPKQESKVPFIDYSHLPEVAAFYSIAASKKPLN